MGNRRRHKPVIATLNKKWNCGKTRLIMMSPSTRTWQTSLATILDIDYRQEYPYLCQNYNKLRLDVDALSRSGA